MGIHPECDWWEVLDHFLVQKRSSLPTMPDFILGARKGTVCETCRRHPADLTPGNRRRWIRYLEESSGVVLFEDFQAVFHHAGGLAELHGAVGDLIAHHLITGNTSG